MELNIGDKITGKLSMGTSGHGFIVSDELESDIFVFKKNTGKGLHLDIVEVEIIKGKSKKHRLEAKVIGIVERFRTSFPGTLQVTEKHAFLVPDCKKTHTDMYIPLEELNGGLDGQKAVAELVKWGENNKSPKGKITEILGYPGESDTEQHAILHEYGLPYNFSDKVEEESESIVFNITEKDLKERKDLRDKLTFTIDPVDAKDFDDALSVEWINGNLRVGIHIADVSHYIDKDSELNKEAYERGTSIYLVDRVVPMLPERLSNGICSLRPTEDKFCFSAIFDLDQNGTIINEWFGRTIINSDFRFTYEEAQEVIENKIPNCLEGIELRKTLIDAILTLDLKAKKIRKRRLNNGSVTFDKREIRFKLDDNNMPIGVDFKISKDANKLIEEYMLLANKRVATYLKSKGQCVNRAHEEPGIDRLEELRQFIMPLGYSIEIGDPNQIKSSLNKLLEEVKGTPEDNMISSLVLKSMKKANYTSDNKGHYGLGFSDYSHFTSPIRRYPDIITHRMLALRLKGSDKKIKNLESMCQHLSEREIKAQKASRDSNKYMECLFLKDKVGQTFKGVVTGVTEYGLFVELVDIGCEGMVKVSEIGVDTYIADTDNYCIKGHYTGNVIKLGDEVDVFIKNVSVELKQIDLNLW